MQRVLHDGHRMQVNEAGSGLLICSEIAFPLKSKMRFPESNVTAPANAAIANVRTSCLRYIIAVSIDHLCCRKVYLALGRAKLSVNATEEIILHRPLKRSHPGRGRGCPVLVGILIQIEGMHVAQGYALLIDHGGSYFVLGHRSDRQKCYKLPSFSSGCTDTIDQVRGEGLIKVSRILNDANPKLRIGMLSEAGSGDLAGTPTRLCITKSDEWCETVTKRRFGGLNYHSYLILLCA